MAKESKMNTNPFSLKGKTILITGASSGIGRQSAINCAAMGGKVILVARNKERLQETLEMMPGEGHAFYLFDLNKIDQIKDFITQIVTSHGKFDGFIHAAGIEITKPLKILTAQDYETVFRVNTLCGFEFVKNLSIPRNFNKSGSIIFISSITGVIARTGVAAYSASKGALISASKVLALELAKREIRVNCISPGTILTPLMENFLSSLTEEQRKTRVSGFPLGLGKTTDVSLACVFLLSDASRWITGQNIIIDGGYTII